MVTTTICADSQVVKQGNLHSEAAHVDYAVDLECLGYNNINVVNIWHSYGCMLSVKQVS